MNKTASVSVIKIIAGLDYNGEGNYILQLTPEIIHGILEHFTSRDLQLQF